MNKNIIRVMILLLCISSCGKDSQFFEKLKTQRVESDSTIVWKNFGPGMSGYNEEFWCHPTDAKVMFMGPDMHVAYGTWDNGNSWQSIKDYDGDGLDLERVNDIAFSQLDPDFGVAIERRGKVFVSHDRGRNWEMIYEIPHAAAGKSYNAHSRIVIHPTDDNVWYIGAGGFWNVKENHRSRTRPNGILSTTSAYGYILKTIDGGRTWKKIASNIAKNLDVGRIRINPNHPDSILIATGQGMFLSADAGENWAESHKGLPNNLPKDLDAYYNPITKQYVLYTIEQSVYEEDGNSIKTKGGVFKSIDGGATWINITGNLGLNFNKITNNSLRNNFAKAISYWFTEKKDANYFKGKKYPEQTLPVFRRLVVNPQNPEEIYIMVNQRHDRSFGPGDIWKTNDGGSTWKIVTRHGSYWHNATDTSYWESKGMETATNVEFAHLQESLEVSLETASACRHLAINSNGEVFIGINQQTQRSKDGGKTWEQIDDYETYPGSNAWIGRGNSNLPGRQIVAETGIPGRILFCSGEHGLWQTAHLGDWPDKDAVAVTQIEGQVHDVNGKNSVHTVSTVAVHPHDPNTFYLLAYRQNFRGYLRKTTNGGKTWENVVQIFDAANNTSKGFGRQHSLQIDPKNPNNMYFCVGNSSVPFTKGEHGVYFSYDGGKSWNYRNHKNSDLPEGGNIINLIMDSTNTETLYACIKQRSSNDPGGLFKSTDKGNTWGKVALPMEIESVSHLFIDRNTKDMFLSTGYSSGSLNSGGAWRSKDRGDTWTKFFDAPHIKEIETSPVNPQIIFLNAAGVVGGKFKNPGFYLSQDDGSTWKKINKGIAQQHKMPYIKCDPYDANVLWCSGWGSGWFKAVIPNPNQKK